MSQSPDTANREQTLLDAALKKPPAERATFLDGACFGDSAMRQRLEARLAAQDSPEARPTKPDATIKITSVTDEAVGTSIGRYKILEKVGEGGCGVVYVAEQSEPVRRRVALKVIKLGMDTKQVIARFEAERQALAMMDHPNIARVLDAGCTETGRPFFVMELVRGIRITDYCDQNQLGTRARLDLFIKICHAIQHAHQKGIIHRDIKPSNILVTLHDGEPVPKVIDFGIAKATEGRLTDSTVYTQLHQFVGTPAYMSPEQAEMSGLDVDTRSDIYSLGVLLYELLAGSTPFDPKDLMSQGLDQMRKIIREKEPQRPSTRFATLSGEELTTTAKRRATDTSKLIHELKGDLDWIVMKCIEKDRTRRYDTANGLAADIKRHLGNEAVLARPPSAAYKFQKAFRRNKIVFTAGAAVALALLVGIVVSVWQARRAREAQALTLQSRTEAEKLSNFMLDDFYTELEPSGRFDTVAALAQRAVAYYDGLPPSLRTPETDRNRSLARARLALVLAKENDLSAQPMIEETLPALQRLIAQGDQSDGTVYALGLILEARVWLSSAKDDTVAILAALEDAHKTLRPLAIAKEASSRVKVEYGNLVNLPSHYQSTEQGIDTCEDALHILEGIGALDLSDLSAAAAWADIADSEARESISAGRFDVAERLEKQVQTVSEGVIAKRPSDLHARMDLTFAPDVLSYIEAHRFHEDAALQLALQSEQAAEDYIRFNPSDANGWFNLAAGENDVACALFRVGRITEAVEKARGGANRVGERGAFAGVPAGAILRAAAVRWEAQRGNFASANQLLREMQRAIISSSRAGVSGWWPSALEDLDRQIKLAADEDDAVFGAASQAAPSLDRLALSEVDRTTVVPFLKWRIWNEAGSAALQLGRFADAESAARQAASITNANGFLAEMSGLDGFHNKLWPQVLLAQAVVAQGRKAEALKTIEPVVAQYHQDQAQGAGDVFFRIRFARALYVQSLAEPDDAEGKARRAEELQQAVALIQGMSDEARQLHDAKQVMAWITAK